MEDNHAFEYSYSAPDQEEIRRIREKYLPKEETKLEQLRKLDASTARRATVYALVVGILGTLVMGTGMSMSLVGSDPLFLPGIVIGCIGIAGIALAYPLYSRILERERARIAPEILRLTEELMEEK